MNNFGFVTVYSDLSVQNNFFYAFHFSHIEYFLLLKIEFELFRVDLWPIVHDNTFRAIWNFYLYEWFWKRSVYAFAMKNSKKSVLMILFYPNRFRDIIFGCICVYEDRNIQKKIISISCYSSPNFLLPQLIFYCLFSLTSIDCWNYLQI